MKLKEALKYINCEEIPSEKELLETYVVMFKEMYDVDLKNCDGTYKSLYKIFSEASKNYHKIINYMMMKYENTRYKNWKLV